MKILVVKDRKSGDWYYNASTFEKLAENSLKILKNFQVMGYFVTREEPKFETIPDGVLNTLPEPMRERYQTDLYWHNQALREFQREKEFNNCILDFLNGDVSIYTPFKTRIGREKESFPLIWEYLRGIAEINISLVNIDD
jgi:hypothetical protein